MEDKQLYHWGIKGQRWGVRRWQNKDGSLTPAGKKRYDDSTGHHDDDTTHESSRRAHDSTKRVSEMSTQELNERIARLQKEKQYAELMAPPPTTMQKVGKWLGGLAKESAGNIIKGQMTKIGNMGINALMDKIGDARVARNTENGIFSLPEGGKSSYKPPKKEKPRVFKMKSKADAEYESRTRRAESLFETLKNINLGSSINKERSGVESSERGLTVASKFKNLFDDIFDSSKMRGSSSYTSGKDFTKSYDDIEWFDLSDSPSAKLGEFITGPNGVIPLLGSGKDD